MKIGELSRRCGVSIRMLRHYEGLGLLTSRRTPSGYRVYDESAIDTVARIAALNAAGVKLDAVRSVLPCAPEGGKGFVLCDALRARLQQTLSELDARIDTLARNRDALQVLLDADGKAGLPR